MASFAVTAAQSLSLRYPLVGSSLADALTMHGPDVTRGGVEYVRLLGAVFLHVDPTHLLLNGLMLYVLGSLLEDFGGWRLLVPAFLLCGVGSSVFIYWFDYFSPTVGASGAIYGLMSLVIAVNWRSRRDLWGPSALLAANLVYTVLSVNVSLAGHLGGMLTGAVLAPWVVNPRWGVRVGGLVVTALGVGACALLR